MSATYEEQKPNRESRTETPGLAASDLENRVTICESDIVALRNGAATQAADLDALYGLHGGNAQSVAALEKRVGDLAVGAVALKNRVECNEGRIAANQAAIDVLRAKTTAVEQDVEAVALKTDAAAEIAASARQTANNHHERHAVGGEDALSAEAVGAASSSVLISAGTGLSGGGDLTANRSLAVKYGTAAGTACQGNDARLSNARPPVRHAATHAVGGEDALSPADIGALSRPVWAEYKFCKPQQCEVAELTTLTSFEVRRGSGNNTLYAMKNGVFSFLENCVVAFSLTSRVSMEEGHSNSFQVYFLKNNQTTIMEQWFFPPSVIHQISMSGIFHMDKGDALSVVAFPHPGSGRLTWAGQTFGTAQEDAWSFIHIQCSPQEAGI